MNGLGDPKRHRRYLSTAMDILQGAVPVRGTNIAERAVGWHYESATACAWGGNARNRPGVVRVLLCSLGLQILVRRSNHLLRRLRDNPELRRGSPHPLSRLGNPNASAPP